MIRQTVLGHFHSNLERLCRMVAHTMTWDRPGCDDDNITVIGFLTVLGRAVVIFLLGALAVTGGLIGAVWGMR